MSQRKLKNWLEAYIQYTYEQESPTAFHHWTAMAVLSAAVGRHIWLDRGYYTLYPNLFIILVAGSAKCRKSISTHIGINLLSELKDKPMVFSQKITTEALIGALNESKVDNQCSGIIYASELSVFMGTDAHKSGLIPTLTDLYDSPAVWSYHTRGRGIEQLRNVSICMLAASTKDWLRACIPADAVGGGFTSRVIFIYQDSPRKAILFPQRTEKMQKLRQDLIDDLNHIREQRGQMDLTPEAAKFATKWYEEALFKVNDQPHLEGYFGRKHDSMFKLSMLLAMMHGDERWITEQNIKDALQLLESNEASLQHIMQDVTASDVGGTAGEILKKIRLRKIIKHSELLSHCWRMCSAVDFNVHIKTLVEAGEIEEHLTSNNRTRYYTHKGYTGSHHSMEKEEVKPSPEGSSETP